MATSRAILLRRVAAKIDTIEVDSCLEESHTLNNTSTDNPVEKGFDVTDHVRPDPDLVNLRCFVSNVPLSANQEKRAVRQGGVQFDTTAPQATLSRGDDTFRKLKQLRDEGTMIKVITSLKTYGVSSSEGMVITGLTINRTRETIDGLEWAMQLKQIHIVENRSTVDVRAKDKRTPKKKKEGAKTPKPEDTDSAMYKTGRFTGEISDQTDASFQP